MMRWVVGCCLAGVLALGGMAPARANLIVNGSFENPGVWGWNSYANGGVAGWTSNNNEIEIGAASTYGLSNYAGGQVLELNGSMFDTVSQIVTGLVIGQDYLLTWAYAGRGGGGAQRTDVSFGGVKVAQDNAVDATDWIANSVVLHATTNTAVLSFAAIDVGGNPSVGNLVDAVTLNVVPEPASLLLLGVGLAAIAARRHLKRLR